MLKILHRLDAVAESTRETSDGVRKLLLRGNRDFAKMNGAWQVSEQAKGAHSGSKRFGAHNGIAPVQSPFAAIL